LKKNITTINNQKEIRITSSMIVWFMFSVFFLLKTLLICRLLLDSRIIATLMTIAYVSLHEYIYYFWTKVQICTFPTLILPECVLVELQTQKQPPRGSPASRAAELCPMYVSVRSSLSLSVSLSHVNGFIIRQETTTTKRGLQSDCASLVGSSESRVQKQLLHHFASKI